MHEATLHKENSFITLTYAPKYLPQNGSLSSGKRSHLQLFFKRLRKAIYPTLIRYYACGEYGDELARPHYHALIFGYEFPDKEVWPRVRGHKMYQSKMLDTLWGMGFCSIGDVTFQSAAYVARYIMKKQTGQQAKEHYKNVDAETGEISEKLPEFTVMSRRPGIASGWFDKFARDVFPDDFVTLEGKKYKTPRYYDKLLARITPDGYADVIKATRKKTAEGKAADNTPERLAVREEVQRLKLRQLERNLDDENDNVLDV